MYALKCKGDSRFRRQGSAPYCLPKTFEFLSSFLSLDHRLLKVIILFQGCQGTMLRTRNGSLIFANPASQTSRTTGTVRRSDDDGRTWPLSFPVSNNNRTPYAYSCLTEVARTDEVGLLWETGSDGCLGPSCRIVFSKIKVL